VTWGDLDANGHMRNTAYLDRVAEVVMHFFTEHGFPVGEFARLGVGPVVQTEHLEYRREFLLMDTMVVRLAIQGLSEDAARFALLTEFSHQDGQSAARVRTTGGWLHRTARALVAPPEGLAAVLRSAPRTADFVQLPGLTPSRPSSPARTDLETSNPPRRPAVCSRRP
jgi:acyl-CoA thioester hydrolase